MNEAVAQLDQAIAALGSAGGAVRVAIDALAADNTAQRDGLELLRSEIERLKKTAAAPPPPPAPAGPMQTWTPATVLRAGGLYAFPDTPTPIALDITVDDVTFVGGWVYSAGQRPAVTPRARSCRFVKVKFDAPPNVDTKNLGPAFEDRGKDSRFIDCTFGRINQGVRPTVGSDGLVVAGLKSGTDVRANAFYADGAVNFTVTHAVILGSIGEIPVRVSPFSGQFSSRGVVALSEIHNDSSPDEKGVLDFRQGTDLAVIFSSLWSTPNRAGESGTAASAGPPVDGDHPPIPGQEARRIYFIGVETHKGKFEFRNAVKFGRVIDCRPLEMNGATDPLVYVTGRYVTPDGSVPLSCEKLLIRDNVGAANGKPAKSPVAGRYLDQISGYDEKDNAWAPAAASASPTEAAR